MHHPTLAAGVVIGVQFPSYTVPESIGSVEVCATLVSGSLERTVVVTLSTSDGTATGQELFYFVECFSIFCFCFADPADYQSIEVELFFNETVSLSCTRIPIEDDSILEDLEFFNVNLTSGDPDVTFMPPMAPVFIVDDDEVTIGFEEELYRADEDQGSVELCAVLQEGSLLEREVVVTLETLDGTAEGSSQVTVQ